MMILARRKDGDKEFHGWYGFGCGFWCLRKHESVRWLRRWVAREGNGVFRLMAMGVEGEWETKGGCDSGCSRWICRGGDDLGCMRMMILPGSVESGFLKNEDPLQAVSFSGREYGVAHDAASVLLPMLSVVSAPKPCIYLSPN
ncbi:hypothetical protein LR48_Vigan10g120400 [Vigna angularis]|uniref:Uncharacterized protein n=1 Tax=Phaseolus angularis TaxID=3914 RepID=A0A0L9VK71_PHAAN|nr:hypothetical protein LR48_Vigan10g120400 [Vigna angularis]